MDQNPFHKTGTKGIFSTFKPKSGHAKILTLASILVMFVLSGLYLRFAWNRYQDEAAAEAIMLVQSLEAVIYHEDIAKLSGYEGDLTKSEYIMLKNSLIRMVAVNNPIKFAYLMGERNGDIFFLVDSESPESPDYSPPGQVYTEANAAIWETFASGKAVLDAPAPDRWGTWISALVPIKNPADGRVIAILGLDYEASEWYAHLWKQMIPDVTIVLCVLIIFFVLLYTWGQNAVLKSLGEKLAYSEALYRNVFDQSPIGIAIVDDKKPTSK